MSAPAMAVNGNHRLTAFIYALKMVYSVRMFHGPLGSDENGWPA